MTAVSSTLLPPAPPAAFDDGFRHGVQGALGRGAWARLPEAVRARFPEPPQPADYRGNFEVVRASRLGRVVAFACRLLGSPIVPRTGVNVAALVHVAPSREGVEWTRDYCWPDGEVYRVRSTKVLDPLDGLVERLPTRLCMPLKVYEADGVLHFVSRGYWFDLGTLPGGRRLRLVLPDWLSPGTTHVAHCDEGNGWFRFTLTVRHPAFRELFYQTGRFRAAASGLARARPAQRHPGDDRGVEPDARA
jgi:hypothetical protein